MPSTPPGRPEAGRKKGPEPGRVVVIANPYSGSGPNRGRVETLTVALERRGLEAEAIWEPEEADRALADPGLASRCRCVVVAGGDGTVARAIQHRPAVPLALLPLGTENLFARHFGFDTDAEALAAAIERGATRRLDLGRAGQRLFTCVASAGLDADVIERLARWRASGHRLRRVRRLSYAAPLLMSALRYGYPAVELEAEGRCVRGALAMVFNVPEYALRLPLCPDASPEDGLLDWIVFERPGRIRLGLYALSVLRQRHRRRGDVHHGRARRIRLRCEEPVPMEVDGETVAPAPCELEALPGGLTLLRP